MKNRTIRRTILACVVAMGALLAGCTEQTPVKVRPGRRMDPQWLVANVTSGGVGGGGGDATGGGGSGAGSGGTSGNHSTGDGGSGGGGGSGKVTLTVWHTYTGKEADIFNSVIKAYMDAHPDIFIEVEWQEYASATDKFTTAALAGNAPDIMRFPNDMLGSVSEIKVEDSTGALVSILQPLNPFVTAEQQLTFDTWMVDAMSWKGHIYALPASFDCMALVYNKALFDKAGIGYPTDAWTTDDLVEAATTLTDANADRYGIVCPVRDPYWYLPWQAGFGGRIFDDAGHPDIDSPGSPEAVAFLQSLELDYGFMPQGVDNIKMNALFQNGKAAMVVTGPWDIADIEAARVRYGIAPLPYVRETGDPARPLVGVKGYAMSRQCRHKEAAFALLSYLTSAEVELRFAKEARTLPSVIALYDDPELLADPVIAGYRGQATQERSQPMPINPAMSAVWSHLSTALEKAYNGDASPSDALAEAQAAIEEQIAGG